MLDRLLVVPGQVTVRVIVGQPGIEVCVERFAQNLWIRYKQNPYTVSWRKTIQKLMPAASRKEPFRIVLHTFFTINI